MQDKNTTDAQLVFSIFDKRHAGEVAAEKARQRGVTDKKELRKIYNAAWTKIYSFERRRKTGTKKLQSLGSRLARAQASKLELTDEAERFRAYQKLHRRIVNPHYITKYQNKRRAEDPTYDLICRMRLATRLKLGKKANKDRTVDFLMCSSEFFTKWIESKFEAGMSWSNRKRWHIGHIFPVAACSTLEDVRRSFFYRNLRPQWASENQSLNDLISDESVLAAFICGIGTIKVSYPDQISDSVLDLARNCGMEILLCR